MNDISNTALVTLKCHVQDAMQSGSILNDRSAIAVYNYLDSHLDARSKKLLSRRIKKNLVLHTVMRARKYDDYVRAFLKEFPDANIVNIGCGLDNRFERIDNGLCSVWDLDLPDIMDIKREIFEEKERYRQIGKSVFEFDWLDELPVRPTLFLAEGVFMYCQEKDVKELFHRIHSHLPGSRFVFEVFSSKWLKGWKGKIVRYKLRKQLKFRKEAAFQFGISDSDEFESWSEHYKLIKDWSYLDEIKSNPKEWMRKLQWTVYYEIN